MKKHSVAYKNRKFVQALNRKRNEVTRKALSYKALLAEVKSEVDKLHVAAGREPLPY